MIICESKHYKLPVPSGLISASSTPVLKEIISELEKAFISEAEVA